MNSTSPRLHLQIADWLFISTLVFVTLNPWPHLIPMNFYQLIMLLLLAYLAVARKVFVNKEVVIMGTIIAFSTLIVNPANISAVKIKNIFGLLLTAIVYFSYVSKNASDIQRIFRIYIKIMLFAASLAIVQEVGYLLNIEFLANSNNYWIGVRYPDLSGPFLRVNSISAEPAHFAYMLFPVIYCALLKLGRGDESENIISRKESWLIITALMLTFSLIAYLGLIVIVLYIAARKNVIRILTYTILVTLLMAVSYKYNFNINSKVNSIINLKSDYYIGAHMSSFAVYSNMRISWQAFKDNPIFGSGLGTYVNQYDKYIGDFFDRDKILVELNKNDAASLYLRLPAEFGLLGIIFALLFLWKYSIPGVNKGLLKLVNVASLVGILLYSVRSGSYLSQFLWFFIALYRQSYIEYKHAYSSKKSNNRVTINESINNNSII
ncbi:O-antigen ligase family protein [bacterium]|nr:O-antigen ligase family protein [bacterium]